MPQFDDSLHQEKLAELHRQEEEGLIKTLAAKYGYQYVNLKGVTINPDALKAIPEAAAREANAAGFELTQRQFSLAIRNPHNPETKQLIENYTNQGYQLTVFMCSSQSLEHAWERYKDNRATSAVKKGVLDIDPGEITRLGKVLTSPDKVQEHIMQIRGANTARRITETLEAIFAGAISLKASDIHIEPEEGGIRLRYRLDGVLRDIIDLERHIYERLISRLKLLSGVILNIRNQAQDGRFTFDAGEKVLEIRSSVIPGATGESMVMRLLDPSVASFNLDQLGLNERMYEVMKEEVARPNGLIVTTGPTGSGKTTALYAFLRAAHSEDVKIITIEDPVEYKIDDIVQTQVSEDYSFAAGLRAVLRQDPDIIMVGEIRDREVAETAVHAAQTGHLVFSTLHTNSAVGAFPRLIDLGVDYRAFGSAVNIVLGQRLVRRLCEDCKQKRTATAEEQATIERILKDHPKPPQCGTPCEVYDGIGCESCGGSGFKGRQGIFEAIRVDTEVESAIINDPREHVILEAAKNQKIPTMPQDAVEKIILGITSFAEVARVIDLQNAHHMTEEKTTTEVDDFSAHIV